MTDANFPLTADSDFDDLPRTLRREKEIRAREARDRERRDRGAHHIEPPFEAAPSYLSRPVPVSYGDDPIPAAVKRLEVPFFRLMFFFIKAVLAAIPALLLLGTILYFAGRGLEVYYPDLVRMKILITFPPSGAPPGIGQ